MSQPSADTSVRIAWAADAPEVARVQVAAWRQAYAGLLPAEVLDQLDEEAFAEQWRRSLAQPPDARHRLLVALDHQTVVGFASTGPADDPDADPVADGTITAFHIDPAQTRHGHGSRLLQACADTLAADNFRRAVIWLQATDDALRAFLTEAGWGPDGAHRELDLYGDGSVRAKQVRLHTALVDD
ncbi:GNAT family N-acetyltransferase [Actinopolymorpha rutila]|uniref:Ribosomal protein S18 acetylase RimI-like enzyme n=1 Tax=Actinopolymorpha rutila TaxID=446787 RepID=A0A852ZM01_9ACTN|nr:GNAT family N-acetyltransferase [Actinopolymorpha rutila]NYH89456.1 ribosomal protein S18 acetylase RimI-like enzyme [Actinopolymorpha rutila]